MLHLGFVAFCFLVSGACGLIYENVWVKQISYVFGSTVLASTLVLAAFMAGLALGSATLGVRAAAHPRPLKLYGWLELGITASAMVVPWLLEVVRSLDRGVLAGMALPPAALATFEFVALFAILVVPTAMMGATLPVLCRYVLRVIERPGRAMGALYAINSFGGVAGGLIAGFWMLESLGLSLTAFAAQVLNALVGLAALFVDRIDEALEEPGAGAATAAADAAVAVGEVTGEDAGVLPARTLHVYVFLCGFSAMLFEIALLKLLPLILGSSIHSFSLMVSAFITGIALGSALAGALLPRVKRLCATLAGSLVAVGLLFLASMPLYNHLPAVYLALSSRTALPFAAFQAVVFAFCALVMLVPTLVLGAVLPVATELVTRRREQTGVEVGRLYAANTVGNILGTVLTGLLFIPRLGFRLSMELGVAIDVLAGVALAWRDPARSTPRAAALTACAVIGIGAYAAWYPGVDVARLTMGVFRTDRTKSLDVLDLDFRMAGRNVIWSDEDDMTFVSVDQFRNRSISMRVNGKVDASSEGDMRTQKMLAHLPLLFHPQPKRALVIGLGSGATSAAALRHPIESLETVEISRAVVEAARLFGPWNDWVHHQPRASIIVDDGRHYVERAKAGWDVIISEPSNPWIAGIASLYTREFFTTAREKLGERGILAQWMHTYEVDSASFRMVLRTLSRVFPHVEVFDVEHADVVILASASPIGADLEAVAQRTQARGVREDLASVKVPAPAGVFALHAIAGPDLDRAAGVGEINTDDRPVLEYRAPRAFYLRAAVPRPDPVLRARAPANMFRRWRARHALGADELVTLVEKLDHLDGPLRETMLREALAERPEHARARSMLAAELLARGDAPAALVEARRAVAQDPDPKSAYATLHGAAYRVEAAELSFARPRRFEESLAAARRRVELDPEAAAARVDLGTVHYHRGEWDQAVEHLEAGLERARRDPTVLLRHERRCLLLLAACEAGRDRFERARARLAEMDAAPGAAPEDGELAWRVRSQVRAWEQAGAPKPAP